MWFHGAKKYTLDLTRYSYLQNDDEYDGLVWRDVWEHPVDLSGLANEGAVDDAGHQAHHLHGSLSQNA